MTTRPALSAAEELIALEKRDRKLYAAIDRAMKERTKIQSQTLRLRMGLSRAETEKYVALLKGEGK